MELGERDARELLEAAARLAEVVTLEDFISCTFAVARSLIDCDIVFYNEMEPALPRSRVRGDPQEPCDAVNPVWERHMDEHPVLAHALATGDLSPLAISDFLPRRAFRRTALWDEVYRPLEVDDQLGAPIRVFAGGAVGVAVARRARTFDSREHAIMSALRPFLTAAHRRTQLEELVSEPQFEGYDLTGRERQVLALAVRGHTNREIAAELFLSARTVAKHLERAYAKLGVHGRRDAARLVAQ